MIARRITISYAHVSLIKWRTAMKRKRDLSSEFIQHLLKGDIANVTTLLAQDPSLANGYYGISGYYGGAPALTIAADQGYTDIVKALIKAGARVNAKQSVQEHHHRQASDEWT